MDPTLVVPLVRKRNGVKAKFALVKKQIDNHDTAALDADDVSALLDQVASLGKDYIEIQDSMFELCTTDAETETQADLCSEYDIKFRQAKKDLLKIQASFPVATPGAHLHSSPAQTVKLPRIELPKFDGKFEEWSSFKDLFEATIHLNVSLSGAQKLQYLKSYLGGEAAKIISSFPVNDINYAEARQLLIERYDNKREIVDSIMKRLFRHPVMSKESGSGLQLLLDTVAECSRALKVLGLPVEHWDAVLVYTVVEKMDHESRSRWARSLKGVSLPTFDELKEFIVQQVRGLQASEEAGPHNPKPGTSGSSSGRRQASSNHGMVQDKCDYCQKTGHPITTCKKFKGLDVEDRLKSVKSLHLCFNCLRSGHGSRQCEMEGQCKKCTFSHHPLLHVQKKNPVEKAEVNSTFSSDGGFSQVLLSTALVKIADISGTLQVCRALLDSGSQASLITEACVTALGLKRESSSVVISGISSAKVGAVRGQVKLKLTSTVSNVSIPVEALILPKVTGTLPSYKFEKRGLGHIKGLPLADPSFDTPGRVDILLGADVVAAVMRNGIKSGKKTDPIAQNTIFGWTVSGRVASSSRSVIEVNHVHCETETILKKFWELEELPDMKHMTKEEKTCEDHFRKTHRRDESGRFVVEQPLRLPWDSLGHSRDRALSRLKGVERRLAKAPEYRKMYHEFMAEYLRLGHMEVVPAHQVKDKAYYLPHHFVLKLDSTSTIFRVVFDGSCQTTSGVSLNQCLTVGPTIQDDLFTLLLRFRCRLIALKADITKMYRQFKVTDKECDYQRILWREDPMLPVQEYRLRTLTYGTSSAAYLATKCLHQLAEDEKDRFPMAAPVLKDDFYVDDLMGGESTPEKAIELQRQLCGLVKCAGMELRKWATSDPKVLESIPSELREKSEVLSLDTDTALKALGVQWKPTTDSFVFKVFVPDSYGVVTKRVVLSELAKVFDPLGWLSPTTVLAKIMFQELWKLSIGWDEELPADILKKWTEYQTQLTAIRTLTIPRCIIVSKSVSQQFHGFCDASQKAYAAVVYLRSELSDGSVIVRLVAAKTKVAPIKQVTLARLELCGAVMLTKLVKSVQSSTKINCEVNLWSDSTIVLSWLAGFPGRWPTFVANRVAEVQEHFPAQHWHHVRGDENPADCASRGILGTELEAFQLWWTGPEWLKQSHFPVSIPIPDPDQMKSEEKKVKAVVQVSHSHVSIEPSLLTRFSRLSKLKRVTAYCFRFIKNAQRKPEDRVSGYSLSCEEQNEALLHWVCHIQSVEFQDEISCLKKKKPISASSKLNNLTPFLDLRGVLRVGGRLQEAKIGEDQKHQIILPSHHHITKLIIDDAHVKTLHGGFQLLWTTLQRMYWILRARDVVRHQVRKCVKCRRQRAKLAQQLMGNLPSARVNPGRPFLKSGIDYAGPFATRFSKSRKANPCKSYFCIFVCLATKAVHLEAVGDMTTEAFIGALKRFTARRGVSSDLYSDCGRNFVGAEPELKAMLESSKYNQDVSSCLSDVGTNWHFNPPAAPHQGGLWEAGVKSTKHHLKRVVGSAILTFEEFQTVLCQIEACLNSRPLCALSNDPSDYNVLTPGHFLIGEPLNAIPEGDLTSIKTNRLSRWQLTQQITQHFWKRWSAEYLNSLQQRFKWTARRANLQVGDLVLVKEDNLPPNKWCMGRIISVNPGKDALVRVVTVKTQAGQFERPVAKLCPILFNDEQ